MRQFESRRTGWTAVHGLDVYIMHAQQSPMLPTATEAKQATVPLQMSAMGTLGQFAAVKQPLQRGAP
jgi:hypothetical protein